MPEHQSDVETDLDLIQRIAAGEQGALAQLYDRYVRILLGVGYRMLASREEAEEVVADVFCQVWRTAASYDASRSRVDSWLFLITRSRALDRLRRLRRKSQHQTIQFIVDTHHTLQQDPQSELLHREQHYHIRLLLEQMPSDQREVIELAYFNDLTQKQIADQLHIPLGTVKSRLRLGLAKLRQKLQPEELDQRTGDA